MTRPNLAHPTVHLNGTSKADLLEGYIDAIRALRVAKDKLNKAGPTGAILSKAPASSTRPCSSTTAA